MVEFFRDMAAIVFQAQELLSVALSHLFVKQIGSGKQVNVLILRTLCPGACHVQNICGISQSFIWASPCMVCGFLALSFYSCRCPNSGSSDLLLQCVFVFSMIMYLLPKPFLVGKLHGQAILGELPCNQLYLQFSWTKNLLFSLQLSFFFFCK